MATTIRNLKIGEGGITVTGYNIGGVATIRCFDGLQSVALNATRTDITNLVSALLDVAATLPGED